MGKANYKKKSSNKITANKRAMENVANIKIESVTLNELKKITNEPTGQKAVKKALLYFLKEARQRDLLNFLNGNRFSVDFNPLQSREDER